MSRDAFEFCDDLGPKSVFHIYEPSLALKAMVVVDNVAAGPAIGGIRMRESASIEECFRLARAMTFKNAAAGLPHGGAKAVIIGDPDMSVGKKEELIRALACASDPSPTTSRGRTWAPTRKRWRGSRTKLAVRLACPVSWAAFL